MGKRKSIITALETFERGRPAAWTHKNLLKRALDLAVYARNIIAARGVELGITRDRDYKYRGIIEKLQEQLEEAEGDITSSEAEVHTLEERIERLQEVASAAAWVIADHMSGSYGAVVPPNNKPITPEQHGDGICRVLASHLAKLELPDDMEGVADFVSDDFNRTYGLLVRRAPKEVRR